MDVKKILYLTYDGLTDPLGQSQILPYVKGLSKFGYKFTILSCDKPNRYMALKDTILDLCDEDNIEWVSFPFTNKYSIFSKIIDRRKFKKIAFQLYKKNKYDLIHCRSYISAEIGLKLKQKFSSKFLFDMRGLWADEKVDGGNWNLNNPIFILIYKYYKNKERQFLENANHTVSLTEVGKNEINTWGHLKNNLIKITVIPCCVDTLYFDASTINFDFKNGLQLELGICEGNFVISYLGSIGTWYMLSEMLDFFIELLKYKPEAKFLFITSDNQNEIISKAREKNIDLLKIVIRSAERSQVPTLISLSQLSIFFIKPTYSKISSSPTKQAEIMAMGVPIITNYKIGDVDIIFSKINAGFVCKNFDSENYNLAIEKIIKQPFNSTEVVNFAKKNFSLQIGVDKYYKIYEEIFNY